MSIESFVGYILSFLLGLVSALLWAFAKHGNRLTVLEGKLGENGIIASIQKDISGLRNEITDIKKMADDVTLIKNSPIFRPEIAQQLLTVCSEHKGIHDQLDQAKTDITEIKTTLKIQ